MAFNIHGNQVCKFCGAAIIFAAREDSKVVALQATQEVYAVVYPGTKDRWFAKRAKQEVYVNHSLICKGKP